MKNILKVTSYLLIFSFFLPAGYLLNIPIANYSFILSWVSLALLIMLNRKIIIISKKIILTIIIPFVSLVGYYIGNSNILYSETASKELNSFITLIFVPILFWLIIKNNFNTVHNFKIIIILGLIIKLTVRIIIELFFMMNLIGNTDLLNLYQDLFNATPVTLLIQQLNFLRIQVPSDALPLVVYSFILIDSKITKKIKIFFIFLLAIFSFIVYSRVFLAQYVFSTLLGLFLTQQKITKKRLLIYSVLSFVLTVSLYFFLLYGNFDFSSLLSRFSGTETESSDLIRDQQEFFLMHAFILKPLFGNGLGYYIPGFIRNIDMAFSYELEYLSFLTQFGIIGFLTIIISIILNFTFLIKWKGISKQMLTIVMFNFLVWGFKPLFNPSFLSINSASIITILIVYSQSNFKKR